MNTFEVIDKPSFRRDVMLLHDQTLWKKLWKGVEKISHDPFTHSKKIFKDRYKNLYRYRLGDHRLCYTVGTKAICLVAVGPRDVIYDRFELGKTAVPDLAELHDAEPQFLPTVVEDVARKVYPDGGDNARQADAAVNDSSGLFERLLYTWGVPAEIQKAVIACESPEDLLSLDIADQYKELILHLKVPPTLEQIMEEPSLQLPDPEDLENFDDGMLTTFLLRLDPEQQRVSSKMLRGPALVRGGPGTGKSVVALHRIRNLFSPDAQNSLFKSQKPRVLFLTYTNALTRASRQQLDRLLDAEDQPNVDVQTLDSLATRLAMRRKPFETAEGSRACELIDEARKHVHHSGTEEEQAAARRILEGLPTGYLLDEFDWVIDGRDLQTQAEYLSVGREGRGTRLDKRARVAVWELHREWLAILSQKKLASFVHRQRTALKVAATLPQEKKFDCVVIDEAQDLKPVGLRLAAAMAKTPEGLYLTADEGQSIYGRGYSWRQVSEDFRVQGRTTILKRNYRATAQIQAAADEFLKECGLYDADRGAEAVRQGPKPVCREFEFSEAEALAQFLRSAAAEIRAPLSVAAVLVRTHNEGKRIVASLGSVGIEAEWCGPKSLNLDAKTVKVLTVHSSKGLEFPIVAIAGLREGIFPLKREAQVDEDEAAEELNLERRLFHVAMTRAMRRLLIAIPKSHPSPFIADLSSDHWQWTAG